MGKPKGTETKDTNSVTVQNARRFILSISNNDTDKLNIIGAKLEEANNKKFGGEIKFSDLAYHAIKHMTDSCMKDLKMNSVSKRDLIEKAISNLNEKNPNSPVTEEEILLKFLKISPKELFNEVEQ